MDCRRMEPIVYEVRQIYSGCMEVKKVNFHDRTEWHELLSPMGSPEFDLLTSSKEVIHRWFGFTETEEFSAIIDPLCK